MSDVEVIFEFVKALFTAGGPYAVLGVLLTGVLKVYRLGFVQKLVGKVSSKLLWDSFPPLVKVLLPFVLAFVGVVVPGVFLGGLPLTTAIVAGIEAGLVAIGAHHAFKEAKPKDPTVVSAEGKPLPVDEAALVKKLLDPVR